jgi:hypothetical protein
MNRLQLVAVSGIQPHLVHRQRHRKDPVSVPRSHTETVKSNAIFTRFLFVWVVDYTISVSRVDNDVRWSIDT